MKMLHGMLKMNKMMNQIIKKENNKKNYTKTTKNNKKNNKKTTKNNKKSNATTLNYVSGLKSEILNLQSFFLDFFLNSLQ